ncbi:peptidase [Streptomyces microflavus]
MSPTSCARLRDARALAALGLAAGIAVPAALLGGPQAAAHSASLVAETAAEAAEAADEQPACGDPGAKEFPIETRIQEAPKTYVSGGGYGTWFLDLTNTTDTSCRALHPVLVLNDEDRKLTADQIQLKFSEPGRPGTEHRVTWETTDRHEQIGVFDGGDPGPGSDSGSGSGDSDDGFLGFTVPAGSTVSVRVRMAFTSDTGPGRVTAHAAVVQRRHQDRAKGAAVRTATGWGSRGVPVRDRRRCHRRDPRPERTEEDIGSRTDVPAEPRPRTDASSGAPTPTRTPPPPTRTPARSAPRSPARRPARTVRRLPGRTAARSGPRARPTTRPGGPSPNSPAPDRSCCPGPEPSPGSSSSAAGSS